MLNPITLLATALGDDLARRFLDVYGEHETQRAAVVRSAANLVIEQLGNSDALYHDASHTTMVTLVGQAILRGRILTQKLDPDDWLHYTVALLCHDLGYVRGICPGDTTQSYVTGEGGSLVTPPRGASDAFLTPYHVERGKLFVRARAHLSPIIDADRIARAIELTRFPVPDDDDHAETETEAGLVRAADLIGQLGDPWYPRKVNALYCEFAETGAAERLGYKSPADIADAYPRFFWSRVEPYIGPALTHLERSAEGKQWISNLYAHVFVEEHRRLRPGPERGLGNDRNEIKNAGV